MLLEPVFFLFSVDVKLASNFVLHNIRAMASEIGDQMDELKKKRHTHKCIK